jgi:hypothetical protein
VVRPIDANTLAALKGSRTGDELVVWVWRDGQLVWPEPLPLAGWALDWDDSREAQSLNLTVKDPTGELAPWLLEDPLGAGGSRLQVIYSVGGAGVVNQGWYRVTQPQPDETWAAYTVDEAGTVTPDSPVPPGSKVIMQPMGATITVQAYDLAAQVVNDKFIAPESPVGASPTVIGEIKRLLLDRVPVLVVAGVTDTPVNTTLVYEQQGDRWAAVQDLAARIGAGVRMNGDGQAEVYPITSSPVATLYGGPEGLLVRVNRAQRYEGLYNIFVADGTATVNGQQQPVRGVAQITGGPLRVDGPHGRYPKFYSSTMLTTQEQCDAYAAQMRDTQLAGLTTDLIVEALPLPHLQIGDWVTVANPVVNGMAVPLNGRVVAMGLRGAGTTVDRMPLTVRCDYAAVKAAFGSATSTTIAGPILTNQPGVPAAHASAPLYPSDSLFPSDSLHPSGG